MVFRATILGEILCKAVKSSLDRMFALRTAESSRCGTHHLQTDMTDKNANTDARLHLSPLRILLKIHSINKKLVFLSSDLVSFSY